MSKTQYRLAISEEAKFDLDDIWLYTFDKWGVEQADKYFGQIISTMKKLAVHDLVWENADHIMSGYFKYKIGKHIIFFKLNANNLEIIRVLHCNMDIQAHL